MADKLNSFVIKYFDGEEVILDISVNHWDQYVSALKVSSTVIIKETAYKIKEINMVHKDTGSGMIIELYVSVQPANVSQDLMVDQINF